ncbi:MAG TPA: AAA family ATPase [Candidatus Tectomicrobia bacterium]|nr:AAA family ATPase [Candidatus Tectomicrobia bacterium]
MRGQVVFIAGDAGIGKSRLALECRRTLAAAEEAVTWPEGRCIAFGQSIPFLPLIDQLRENIGIEELGGEPEIIAKVEHGMRRMGGRKRRGITPAVWRLLASSLLIPESSRACMPSKALS